MTLKSTLLNVLLIPVWLSLFIGATCTYWSFKFDALADVKEAKFKSVEQQLSSIGCKEIRMDAVLSIVRQTLESPRDFAKIFQALGNLIFFAGLVNLACVWKYLRSRPAKV